MANTGKQYPFSRPHTTTVKFDQPLSYTPEYTITGALTLTKNITGAQVGYGEIRRYVADGVHTPDLSGFALEGPGSWVNTAGTVNKLFFYFDGSQYCVVITQPGAGGTGGGGGDTTPPSIVTVSISTGTPNVVDLAYGETLDSGSVPAGSAYTIKVNTVTRTISSVSISGSSVHVTFGGAAVVAGDAVTLDYVVPGSNPVQDVAGNDAAALTGVIVDNGVSGGGSYDTDAQAIIDAKTTAGVSWNTTKQDGVNAFVLALKSASIWTKARQFGNLSDGSFAKNKINWKSPGTKDLSSSNGSVTYGANGAAGDGSSGYIDTGIIPDTEYGASGAPGFSASAFALYCRTAGSTDVTFDFGAGINLPGTQIVLTAGWGTARGVVSAGDQVNVATDSQGFFSVSRTGSTSLKLYKNGSQIGSTNTTDVSGIDNMPTDNLFLLAFNDNGAASLFSARELSFWWIGDALNDTEVGALNTAFQNLKTAFGW